MLPDEHRPHAGNRPERKEAYLLGPTKADWGQTRLSFALSWAEHEPTWAQLAPKSGQLAPTWAQVEPNNKAQNLGTFGRNMRNSVVCGRLVRSWAQDRNMASHGFASYAGLDMYTPCRRSWPCELNVNRDVDGHNVRRSTHAAFYCLDAQWVLEGEMKT